MSRLDEALESLERAVARLEAVCADRKGKTGGHTSEAGSKSGAETARLREAAGDIAARIDEALARVGRALGGGGVG